MLRLFYLVSGVLGGCWVNRYGLLMGLGVGQAPAAEQSTSVGKLTICVDSKIDVTVALMFRFSWVVGVQVCCFSSLLSSEKGCREGLRRSVKISHFERKNHHLVGECSALSIIAQCWLFIPSKIKILQLFLIRYEGAMLSQAKLTNEFFS